MMPEEASKESKKPKHDLERLADGMEAESSESKMPDFMKDADMLLALEAKRDKMIDQKSELSSASNVLELKPGVASGAIDKEINGLQDKVNDVLGKYGKEATAFQIDAYRVGELKDNVGDAEAILKSLEAEYKSETNRDKKAKLERQMDDATKAWEEARGELAGMKDKYVAKEAAAKAELAGATEADIDAALEPLEEQVQMSRETDDAIKMAMEASAEAIKEKADRQKAMAERVDARLKEEDEMAKETDDALKMAMEASAEALAEGGQRDTMTDAGLAGRLEKEAMAKETDDAIKMAMEASAEAIKEKEEMAKETDDAIKMAIEASAEALAEEGKRDTIPDAGMADRMEKEEMAKETDDAIKMAIETSAEGLKAEEAEKAAKAEAEARMEEEFFEKGEVIDAVHGAGQTLEQRSAAEVRGDAGAERQEMAMRAEVLRGEMPVMDQQLSRVEKMLSDLGVKDADAAMAKRATGGFMEKAKGFLGGLFSKKTREMNRAMDLYASIRDQHNAKTEELGKLEMQLNPTERQKQMSQIASENRQGR